VIPITAHITEAKTLETELRLAQSETEKRVKKRDAMKKARNTSADAAEL
jgi:hypothetical protein